MWYSYILWTDGTFLFRKKQGFLDEYKIISGEHSGKVMSAEINMQISDNIKLHDVERAFNHMIGEINKHQVKQKAEIDIQFKPMPKSLKDYKETRLAKIKFTKIFKHSHKNLEEEHWVEQVDRSEEERVDMADRLEKTKYVNDVRDFDPEYVKKNVEMIKKIIDRNDPVKQLELSPVDFEKRMKEKADAIWRKGE